jgi:hypothetical protein
MIPCECCDTSSGTSGSGAARMRAMRHQYATGRPRRVTATIRLAIVSGKRRQNARGSWKYVGDHEPGGATRHPPRSREASRASDTHPAPSAADAEDPAVGNSNGAGSAHAAANEHSEFGQGDDRRSCRDGAAVDVSHAHNPKASGSAADSGDAENSRHATGARSSAGAWSAASAQAARDARGGRGVDQRFAALTGVDEDHRQLRAAHLLLQERAHRRAASQHVPDTGGIYAGEIATSECEVGASETQTQPKLRSPWIVHRGDLSKRGRWVDGVSARAENSIQGHHIYMVQRVEHLG